MGVRGPVTLFTVPLTGLVLLMMLAIAALRRHCLAVGRGLPVVL